MGGMLMQCSFIKKDGQVCEAKAIKGDEFCFTHSTNPKIVEKRRESNSLGGKNGLKNNFSPAKEKISIQTSQNVLDLLEQTINDVRMNKISTNQANTICFLSNTLIKILQQRLIESKISMLEEVVFENKKR
jgi:hypothetical protein